MKLSWLLVLSLFSQLSVAVDLRDFTKQKCKSSTSDETFQCPEYVNECAPVALNKILDKATYQHAVVDAESFDVSEVDDRFYNPSKYIWFSARAKQEDGTVIELGALTQKSYLPLKNCF